MSTFMILIMSFVVTMVNVGWGDQTISKWLNSFFYAWIVGFPLMYFFAPIFRIIITKNVAN
jgi:hypothetical protein